MKNHPAEKRLCMAKSPEQAVIWGKLNYTADNFRAEFGNTYFPNLSVNGLFKAYVHLEKDINHEKVIFHRNEPDLGREDEAYEHALQFGLSEERQHPLSSETELKLTAVAGKLAEHILTEKQQTKESQADKAVLYGQAFDDMRNAIGRLYENSDHPKMVEKDIKQTMRALCPRQDHR